jgi:hypothetical protein
MKYNLAEKDEAIRAFDYLSELVAKESLAEVKKISPKRTINQNSYLHLLISAFGLHFGYTIEEAKIIYKEINKGIYQYEKKGRVFLKSSADLNKEEMAKTIDLFRSKSAENGYPLPPATNKEWLRSMQNAVEQSSYYL